MDKTYWHTKWATANVAFDQQDPNTLLVKFMDRLALPFGARVLVPLAGKSIDMLWLMKHGFRVVGVSLSEIACRRFFEEFDVPFVVWTQGAFTVFHNDGIELWCGDFFEFSKESAGRLDAIYDRAALIALPQEMRTRYVEHLLSLCHSGTHLLLMAMSYCQASMTGPPFSVDEEEIRALFGERRCIIEKLHDDDARLSVHLKNKGLTSARETVYYIR